MTPPFSPVSPFVMPGNPLLDYVVGLSREIGVHYRPGSEDAFVEELKDQGVAAGDLRVLSRVVAGRPVKLHEYASVVNDIRRIHGGKRAASVLEESLTVSIRRMNRAHDRAMRVLDALDLTESFVWFSFLEALFLAERGIRPTGGINDASREFRHFIEAMGLFELRDLARRYSEAAAELDRTREFSRTLRLGNGEGVARPG